jgi:flagellar biosynthesis/type III secretory pathway protein FliH
MQVAHRLVEAGGVQVGVDLGRLDAGMAEQLLQHAQVSPA